MRFAFLSILILLCISTAVLSGSPYSESVNPFSAIMVLHLDNSTGSNATTIVDSLRGYNGTTVNVENPDFQTGETNFSTQLLIDGVDEVIDARFGGTSGPTNISACDAYSITFWVRVNNVNWPDSFVSSIGNAGNTYFEFFSAAVDLIKLEVGDIDVGANRWQIQWAGYTNLIGNNMSTFIAITKKAGCTAASDLSLYINATNLTGRTTNTAGTLTNVTFSDNFSVGARTLSGSQSAAAWFDDVVFYPNKVLSQSEITSIFQGNFTTPREDFLNMSGLGLHDPAQFNYTTVNFNVTVNSTFNFTSSLLINGTLNQSRNFNAGTSVNVSFNVTFSDSIYSVQINSSSNTSGELSSNITFYVDTVNPQLSINFTNFTVYMKNWINIQFNFSDSLSLFSYNITIDNTTINYSRNINSTTFHYNLSYDPNLLSAGNHSLHVTWADGHTAKKLRQPYRVKKGVITPSLSYEFPEQGSVTIKAKGGSLFDRFDTTRKKDRYTFEYEPFDDGKQNYTFEITSDQHLYPIRMANSQYKQYLIVGEHWLDFVTEEDPNVEIVLQRINNKKFEVTLVGVTKPELIKFNSIGDLNIITRNYSFAVTNATVTYSDPVNELEEQTILFRINITGSINSTSAYLTHNGSNRSIVKTQFSNYDLYNSTFITPRLSSGLASQTINFTWFYEYNYSGGTERGSIVNNQTIFTIGIDNCTLYSMRAVNISLRDETTNNLLNGTIGGYFKAWVSAISNYSEFVLNWSHTTVNNPVAICISPNSSTYYSYIQMEYESTGYQTKTYYFDNTTLDNQTDILNLYLTNGTTQVTFTVSDQNDNRVSNVIIKVLSYDLTNNNYRITEVLRTDSDGQALGQIILNTQWYQFALEYNGTTVLFTEPTKITSTTKNFRINLGSDFFSTVNLVNNINNYLFFTNSTLTFSFKWNDPDAGSKQYCLTVYRIGAREEREINSSCSSESAAQTNIPINENVSSNHYRGIAKVILSDGDEFQLDVLDVEFDQLFRRYGLSGLFGTFFLTLFLVGFGIMDPRLGVLFGIIGVILGVILDFTYMSLVAVFSVIIWGGLTIYRLNR